MWTSNCSWLGWEPTRQRVWTGLAETIRSWGDHPPLQMLDLDAWRMPEDACTDVLQAVATCRHLTHLNLSRNTLNQSGRYLIELIQSQGSESPLQMLKLDFCPMRGKSLFEFFLFSFTISMNSVNSLNSLKSLLIFEWNIRGYSNTILRAFLVCMNIPVD